MRISLDNDVDLSKLSERLGAVLGRDVALSARMPGQLDEQGKSLPGVLVVLDKATGEPLDLPASTRSAVQAAITAHVPPVPTQSPASGLVESLRAATDVEGLKSALLDYASSLVEREERSKAAQAARPRQR